MSEYKSAKEFTVVIHDIKHLATGDVVRGTIEVGRDPVYGFLIQPLLETAVWNLQTGAMVTTYDDAKEALHMALAAFAKKYIALEEALEEAQRRSPLRSQEA